MNVTMGYYNDPQQQQQNQMLQQGLSTVGTIGGAALGGPVGGAVGGALGGAIGGLLGGNKKKKAKVKIFIPNWTGAGGGGPQVLGPEQNASGPSSGMSALSGGLGGLANGLSIGKQFGGGAGGTERSSMMGMDMPTDFSSSPLGKMFGASPSPGASSPYDDIPGVMTANSPTPGGYDFNSAYFNRMNPGF